MQNQQPKMQIPNPKNLKAQPQSQNPNNKIAIVAIEQAREFENKEPLGIQYHVGDVSKPFEAAVGEGFDVVYGAFFLHYSSDKEMLKNMIVNIHRVLKKGGIFVTTNDDPGDDKSTGVEGIPNGKTR